MQSRLLIQRRDAFFQKIWQNKVLVTVEKGPENLRSKISGQKGLKEGLLHGFPEPNRLSQRLIFVVLDSFWVIFHQKN